MKTTLCELLDQATILGHRKTNKEIAEYLESCGVIVCRQDELPAADVQPVKRGKDVCDSITDRHCEFKCSLCGEEMLEVWCDNEFNYCPFCGALMQEE